LHNERTSERCRGLAEGVGTSVCLVGLYQDNDLLDNVRVLAAQFSEEVDLVP
jgi:hypothetical protein